MRGCDEWKTTEPEPIGDYCDFCGKVTCRLWQQGTQWLCSHCARDPGL